MANLPQRYVRRDRRIYDHSLCKLCGTAGGTSASDKHPACEVSTCLACGTSQCSSNGLGRGQCAICLYGLLPYWSGWRRTCGYAKCGKQAVAGSVPRVGNACRECLTRVSMGKGKGTLADYIAEQIANRDRKWELIPAQ